MLGVVLMSSCNHYESRVPITSSSTSGIDKEILGEWILSSDNKKEDTSGYLEIIPFSNSEYLVQLKEYADSTQYIESIINLRMFSSKIKNNTFLNLQFIGSESDKTYMIYRFKKVSGNRYKVYFLSKDKFNIEFNNSKSFQEYIEKHPKEFEKSFIVEGVLTRKIEGSQKK